MVKKSRFYLAISLLVIQSFIAVDLSWAGIEKKSTLTEDNQLSPALQMSEVVFKTMLGKMADQAEIPDMDSITAELKNKFFSPENIGLEYIEAEKAILKAISAIGKTARVTLMAENGRSVGLTVPQPGVFDDKITRQIYRKYVAKIYAQAVALGNGPSGNLYVEVQSDDWRTSLLIEGWLIASIQDYFDQAGAPLYSKANAGNRVQVKKKPKDFQPKAEYGLSEVLSRQKYVLRPKPREEVTTLGFDVGGQGIKGSVRKGENDITDELLPFAENEEELKRQDESLRYRYSFAYDHLDEGGTGKEFKDRLKAFVLQVKQRVGEVDGIFINIAGAPDFLNDRMASIGGLDRGFAPEEKQEQLAELNKFIPELRKELGEHVVFAYHNDMVGWGMLIEDGVLLITGDGIGVQLMDKGKAVSGANECGHLIYNSGEDLPSFSKNNSPRGSFEDWAGSVRGILNVAREAGLTQKLIEMGVTKVEVKHIGLAACGINPLDEKQSLQDGHIIGLARDVWEIIERREAQLIILLHKVTGKTHFVFGGGTASDMTGVMRMKLLSKFVQQYREELGIKEVLTVGQAFRSAAWGAALKAQQLVEEIQNAAGITEVPLRAGITDSRELESIRNILQPQRMVAQSI